MTQLPLDELFRRSDLRGGMSITQLPRVDERGPWIAGPIKDITIDDGRLRIMRLWAAVNLTYENDLRTVLWQRSPLPDLLFSLDPAITICRDEGNSVVELVVPTAGLICFLYPVGRQVINLALVEDLAPVR